MQDPGSGIATTIFDAVGNMVNVIDPLGNKTTLVYESPFNRHTVTTDARSGPRRLRTMPASNVVNVIDSVGNKTTFVLDALNRQVLMTDPLGNSQGTTYNTAGEVSQVIDRDGRLTTFAYDAAGRQTGQTWKDTSGNTSSTLAYTYDNNGNVLTAVASVGFFGPTNTSTMTYDALDRVATHVEPFGITLTYSYDATSNRTVVHDSFGGLTTSTYDAANQLTSRQFSNGGASPLREDFSYTARNQLAGEIRYSDLAGTTKVGLSTFTYDPVGRFSNLQHVTGAGVNISNYTYTYDLASRVTTETLNGTVTTYSYDATNQLTNDGSAYTYDLNGNRTMTGYQTGPGNQLLNDGTWGYVYDNNGNVIKKSKGVSAETWTYGYDNANHLLWARDAATDGGAATTWVTFTYDAFGDRIQKDLWTQTSGVVTTTRQAYDGIDVWADLDGSSSLTTRISPAITSMTFWRGSPAPGPSTGCSRIAWARCATSPMAAGRRLTRKVSTASGTSRARRTRPRRDWQLAGHDAGHGDGTGSRGPAR